ncbi:MAG TPA: 7-cyano-7-deazaguanine synthase QueC [Deltaproteobacteria bacterium]|nr:MAG: 7-cyano-7-deazaguanine synthase QueC [Deltaproteobacteria bacterium GWA2_45_12]HBF12163.1 7-cyano-7-deazaguanine synthase QueC [Deltaproteobacteria bacterium]
MRDSSIILLSGGLDSTAALAWAKTNSDVIMGLTLHYGQRSAQQEIRSSSALCAHYDVLHKVVEVPFFSEMESVALTEGKSSFPSLSMSELDDADITAHSAKAVWVPNRNGVFLNMAASFAENKGASWVVVGFNKEEAQSFPDNSEEFVSKANEFFKYSTLTKVKVVSPMGLKTKKEIVKWCLKQKVPLNLLWSCYRGGDKMCGECESCLRLKRALQANKALELTEKLF